MSCIHDYQIISDTAEAQVEVCKECKKKLITRKDKRGRIDNLTYLKEHQRDFAQKTGPTKKLYDRFYGNK